MNPRAFDLYVRTLTTALLALAFSGGAIYAVLARAAPSPFLVGTAGLIIGVYFGAHVSQNGRGAKPRADDEYTAVIKHHPKEPGK